MQIDGELIEVTPDFDNSRDHQRVIGDRHYDGLQASDGTDISTRAKHRAYMKTNGLTTIDDFTQHFAQAERLRARFFTEGYDPTRRPAIARAVHQHFDGGKR